MGLREKSSRGVAPDSAGRMQKLGKKITSFTFPIFFHLTPFKRLADTGLRFLVLNLD